MRITALEVLASWTGDVPEGYKGRFVIGDHYAQSRHWDLRLEVPGSKSDLSTYIREVSKGRKADEPTSEPLPSGSVSSVLRSWAVPKHKLPTTTPVRAFETTNHPVEYIKWTKEEREIPEGLYGAGKVKYVDSGEWVALKYQKDEIVFALNGDRFKGIFALVRTDGDDWLFVKVKKPEYEERLKKSVKTRQNKESPLAKLLRRWKDAQRIKAMTLDELKKAVRGQDIIIQTKYDGEADLLDYRDGKARFSTIEGTIRSELPVLDEIVARLKGKVDSVRIVGELVGVDAQGRVLPFDEVLRTIRSPTKEQEQRIHWRPYDVLSINGKAQPLPGEKGYFEAYKENFKKLRKWFSGAKRVAVVTSKEGRASDLQTFWDREVERKGNEGIVVKAEDGKVYNVKATADVDAVVIAVKEELTSDTKRPKGRLGSATLALMPREGIFIVIGDVGTGFSAQERKDWWSWAQRNRANFEGDEQAFEAKRIFVKPERIVAVAYQQVFVGERRTYKYSRGSYQRVEKELGPSLRAPRFLRIRTDKTVNVNDLRLTQIPNWGELKKRVGLHVAADEVVEFPLEKTRTPSTELDRLPKDERLLDKIYGPTWRVRHFSVSGTHYIEDPGRIGIVVSEVDWPVIVAVATGRRPTSQFIDETGTRWTVQYFAGYLYFESISGALRIPVRRLFEDEV